MRKLLSVTVILTAAFGVGILIFIPTLSEKSSSGGSFSYSSAISELRKKYSELPENSSESREILNVLRKAKEKQFGHIETQNPGAFIEALAEIKTGRNGETYPPDYKNRALLKARDYKGRATKCQLRAPATHLEELVRSAAGDEAQLHGLALARQSLRVHPTRQPLGIDETLAPRLVVAHRFPASCSMNSAKRALASSTFEGR